MANRVDRSLRLKKAIVSSGAGGKPVVSLPAVEGGPYPTALENPGSLSKLSHDIRTQLYIIIGFAELMLMEIPGRSMMSSGVI